MPSSSKKQHDFMEAIANNKAFAKKVGVPQSVGRDFASADKNRKLSKGGDTMATKGVNPFAKFEKSGKDKDKGMKEGSKKDMAMDKKQMAMKHGGMAKMTKMAAGGMTKMAMGGGTSHRMPDGTMMAGKMKAGGMTKMAMGGMTGMGSGGGSMRNDRMMQDGSMMPNTMKKGGMTKMKDGGFTKSADGIAQRGKTKAKKC
jgi:hypothetical protein